MKRFAFAAVIAFVATGASAQVSNFGGFSAALNLNAVSVNTKLQAQDAMFDGVGQQSWNGAVQAAYGFVSGASTVVSVGATYGLGKSKAGEFDLDGDGANLKTKSQLSVYVEPGFLLSNSTLVYGKLSYEKAKAVGAAAGEESSESIKGSGFGFGLRTMVDKTSFVQVEVRQISYRSVDVFDGTAKPKAIIGTVGFGMKF